MRRCAQTTFLLALLLCSGRAAAQTPEMVQRQISARPLMLIFNQLAVDVEQALPGHWSLLAGAKLELSHSWTSSQAAGSLNAFFGLGMPSQYSKVGFGLEVGPRYWVGGRPLQGLFLHPSLGYDWSLSGTSSNASNVIFNLDLDSGEEVRTSTVDVPNVHRLMANLRAGYQWALARHLLLSLDGGLYYAYLHADSTYAGDDGLGLGAVKSGWHAAGFSPDLHVALGGWF